LLAALNPNGMKEEIRDLTTIIVEENKLSGYKCHRCNNPDGSMTGDVGMVYKESLPLRI